MHEGKALKKLVHDDDRKVGEIAAKTGMSRGYLYMLYKQAEIDSKWKKKFNDIGIVVDSTNVESSQHPHKVLSGTLPLSANGKSKHIAKSEMGERSSRDAHGGGMGMAEVLSLSLTELLQLQREGEHDSEMGKLIARLILYQERIKALEEKVLLLKDNLADLRKK